MGFWAKLMDCFYCLSLWIAVPFAVLFGQGFKDRVLLWLAFSAGASLLERATDYGRGVPPARYTEDKEDQHVLLRQTEGTVPNDKRHSPGS
jgi:hypothetical protein